jgi:hypothetical protein
MVWVKDTGPDSESNFNSTGEILAINDRVVTHNPRVSVTHPCRKTWNLHFKPVTEEDLGRYFCQIRFKISADSMQSQVSDSNVFTV